MSEKVAPVQRKTQKDLKKNPGELLDQTPFSPWKQNIKKLRVSQVF